MAHGFKATEIAWSADVGSSAERLTLLALAKWANDDLTCFPSLSTLVTDTKLNEKTIREALKRLHEAGFITIKRQAGHNTRYAITPTKIGSTKNGSTEIGTPTKIGSTPLPKTAGVPLPKTVPEQITEQITEQINLSVDDSPFLLEPDQPQAATVPPAENTTSNTAETATDKGRHPADAKSNKPPKRKAITHQFELTALPADWRTLCEQIRPDLDPVRVFVEFCFYWTQGKGQGTRRSDKGWTSTWMNWVKRQKEQRVTQTYAKPAFIQTPFDEIDYSEGINDDNSF